MNPELPLAPHPNGTQPFAASPTALQPASQNALAVTSLIFGIIGFMVILPFIGPLLAIIFGAVALHQIKHGKGIGRGMAHAGLWLGVAGLALQLFFVVIMVAVTYNGIQQKTTDTVRKNNVFAIQSQLEEYYDDNGYYPAVLNDLPNYSALTTTLTIDEMYQYDPTPNGCSGTDAAIIANPNTPECSDYSLRTVLDDGDEFSVSGGREDDTINRSDSVLRPTELLTN